MIIGLLLGFCVPIVVITSIFVAVAGYDSDFLVAENTRWNALIRAHPAFRFGQWLRKPV